MADEEKDWGAVIDSIDEAGIPAAENAPPSSGGVFGDKVAPYGAVDVLRRSLGVDEAGTPAPTEEGGRQLTIEQPDWGAVLDSMPEVQLPGYLTAMKQGLQRGVGHVEAAIPTLQGVGAELTGDDQAAAGYAAKAAEIEKAQSAPVVSDVLDIQSGQDFLYWASERLGEQAPNMALMAAGGGIGGVLAKLVGRGLISSELAATLGAAVPNIGLETAGTAQEQRTATGSYNPKTSILAGVGKGILETYGPVKFMKEIHGASILGAAGRAAVREGILTEPWQEAIDILARKYNDPNYSFFNEDMTWLSKDVETRLAESAATGLVTGGGYAGTIQAGAKGLEKVLPEGPTSPQPVGDVNQFPPAPPPLPEAQEATPPPDEPLEPGALSWLRQMQLKKQLEPPYDPRPATEPVVDVVETGPVEQGIKLDWQTELANTLSTEQVLNIEDDNISRYALVGAKYQRNNVILTDTDLEEHAARSGPIYNEKDARVVKVDMKSLQPGAITATVWDLPNVEDNRIWFLPGTSVPEQQQLLAQYEQIHQQIEAIKPERFTQGLSAEAQAQRLYEPLLNSGLRVIPSRGSSFNYNGAFEGKAVKKRPTSNRGVQAYTGPQDLKAGAKLYPPDAPEAFTAENVRPIQQSLALDFNKIPDDAYSVDADGVLTLKKDIDPSAITYGYGITANMPDAEAIVYEHDSTLQKDPNAHPESVKDAANAITWWKDYAPYLKSVSKKLGIAMPSLVVAESPEVSPHPGHMIAYDGDHNIISYNPSLTTQALSPSINTELGFLLTILHEFGHAVTMQSWNRLPPRIQALILEGYKRALLTTRITGSTAHVQLAHMPLDLDVQHRYYYLSFREYLAEQSRRWNSADATAMSPQEKFYKSVGRKLEGMYRSFVDTKLGYPDFARGLKLFVPDYSFNTWYDYLEDGQKDNNPISGASGVGLHKMIRNSRMLNIDIRLPKDLQVAYLQVLEAVQNWGHLIPERTTLHLIDYGPDTRAQMEEDTDFLSIEYGSFDNQKNVLTMILGALAFNAEGDPVAAQKLLVHEAYHSIQKYLEPGERRILAREARRNKTMNHQEIGQYWRYYRDNLREAGVDPDTPMMIALVKELVEHEAVARLVELRLDGKDFGNETNTLLDRIIELFQRIIELVRGNGFQSVKDVETAFFRGEFAERRNQEETLDELEQMDLYGEETGPLPAMRPVEKNNNELITLRQQIYDAEQGYKGFGKEKITGDSQAREDAAKRAKMLRAQYREKARQLAGEDKSRQTLQKRQPARLEEVEPGLEVRIFERAEDVSLGPDQHVSVPTQGREGYRTYAFIANGQPAGYIMTHLEPGIGWDIDMVDIAKRSLGGVTLVKKMVAFMAKDVGSKLQASGFLTPMGYTMLKMTAPEQVVFHVQDVNSGMWYSPRQIQKQIDAAKRVGNKAKETWYKSLLEKVPKAFFEDAAAATMFSKKVAARKGMERDAQRGQQEAEQELLASLGTSQMPVDPMLRSHGQKKGTTEPEHYGMANIIGWLKGQPNVTPNAGILLNTADQISRASKWFFSLQQLTWRNQHIPSLRDYTTLMQQYNTRRMEWTSRADNTLRNFWDIDGLTTAQKDAVGELLFWATELGRHPTQAELAREMHRLNFNQAAYDAYVQITKDFGDFLTALETVTVANIRRDLANQPTVMAQAIAEVAADMAQLRSKPYFPMARFGEYYITVRNQFLPGNPPVVRFSCYATERERNAAINQVRRLHPGMDMTIGKVPENVQEFMGLPATLLKAIRAKLPGITAAQSDWLEQFEAIMAPERSFRKRFLKRKGTPGYSYDAMRVYAHYFRSGANYLARIEYKDQLEEQVKITENTRKKMWDIESKRALIVEYMQQHLKYVMTGGRDWATFKSLVSIFQLGFSVAAAGMNLTQTPTVTHPYLANIFGHGKSMRELVKVLRATRFTFGKPPPNTPQPFLTARDEMIRQGKIDIGQAPELGGYAEGSNLIKLAAGSKGQRAWRSFSYVAMWMFQHAEQMNRELAFAATYNLALADPNNPHLVGQYGIQARSIPEINDLRARLGLTLEEATATLAAREALDRTQFIYAPWARPRFLQSGAASSVLVFFQFMQNMLYALGNNPGKTHTLVWLLVLYGIAGLPGADDLDKLLKWFSRRVLGKNFSPLDYTREKMHELTEGTIFSEHGADVLLHGISRYSFGAGFLPEGYGVPQFDASANGSMGNIIPGLAPALSVAAKGGKWDEMTAQVLNDVAGAGFGQMFAWMKFMDAGGPFTTEQKKWEMVMPRTAKAVSKAWRYYWEGGDVNPDTGQTFMKFNMQDPDDVATVAAQALGFTPRKVSEKWEQVRMASDLQAWYKHRKTILYIQYDTAMRSEDPDALGDVMKAIERFNDEAISLDLPGLGISPKSLQSSMKGRGRARALRDEDIGLSKGEEQIKQRLRTQFPQYDFEGEVESKRVK
jgi:hypothetical protein